MIDKRKFYINGQWVSPSKPNDYEVINPSLTFNPNDVQSIADTIQKFNEGNHPKSEAKVKDNISELLELLLRSKTSKINNEKMYI